MEIQRNTQGTMRPLIWGTATSLVALIALKRLSWVSTGMRIVAGCGAGFIAYQLSKSRIPALLRADHRPDHAVRPLGPEPENPPVATPWSQLIEGGEVNKAKLPDLPLKRAFSFLSPYEIRTVTARLSKQCFKLSSELLVEELQRCHPLTDLRFRSITRRVPALLPTVNCLTLWTDHLPAIRKDYFQSSPGRAYAIIKHSKELTPEASFGLISWNPNLLPLCDVWIGRRNEFSDQRIDLAFHCGAPLEARLDTFLRTPLLVAATKSFASAVDRLCAAGANVNAVDLRGYNALQCLLSNGCCYRSSEALKAETLHTMQLLLHHGVNIQVADQNGDTPLHAATRIGVEFVKLLVDSGAGLDVQNRSGETPLHVAIGQIEKAYEIGRYDSLELATYLIAVGSDVRLSTDSCKTALHLLLDQRTMHKFFAINGRSDRRLELLQLINRFSDAGVDPKAKDEHRNTPYDLANKYYADLTRHGRYAKDVLDDQILARLQQENYDDV